MKADFTKGLPGQVHFPSDISALVYLTWPRLIILLENPAADDEKRFFQNLSVHSPTVNTEQAQMGKSNPGAVGILNIMPETVSSELLS